MAASVVTLQDVKDDLGIDYVDEAVTRNLERLIQTSDSYLKGAIGVNYPVDDPRAKELALIIISDLYDNRALNNPTSISGNTRRLVDDLALQLRMELRRELVVDK